MTGVDLYDALTQAAKKLPACCAATLEKAIDVNPEARKPLKMAGRDGTIVLTLECVKCGKTSTIVVDRGRAEVSTADTAEASA